MAISSIADMLGSQEFRIMNYLFYNCLIGCRRCGGLVKEVWWASKEVWWASKEVWWARRRCGGLARRCGGLERRCGGLVKEVWSASKEVWWASKEVWWASGESPCLWIARPGFDSRPGASLQCGLRGGRLHCNTVQIKYKTLGLGGL